MSQEQQLVPVFAPGSAEAVYYTKPNARDLVNGAGYTWQPGVGTTPAAFAPFATTAAPSDKDASQEVLDRVGGVKPANTTMAPTPAPAAPAPVVAPQPFEPLETPDEDAAETTEQTTPAPRARRAGKAD